MRQKLFRIGPANELVAVVGERVELALGGVEHGQADAAVARRAARAGGDGGGAGSDAEGGEDDDLDMEDVI